MHLFCLVSKKNNLARQKTGHLYCPLVMSQAALLSSYAADSPVSDGMRSSDLERKTAEGRRCSSFARCASDGSCGNAVKQPAQAQSSKRERKTARSQCRKRREERKKAREDDGRNGGRRRSPEPGVDALLCSLLCSSISGKSL